jgi:large subunit ribosomal protein L3
MSHAVLGKKLGMTQIWGPEGNRLPVTVVQCGPCTVVNKKSAEGSDGYNAVQLAYEEVAERKLNKPQRGLFKKAGLAPHRYLREFRVNAKDLERYEEGQVLTSEHLQVGNFVDVTGTSKGRGFTGVMKRHGYHGAATATHGTHEAFRHAGTGGQGSATPARVPKGMKRPGQHGNTTETTQNVLVVQVDHSNNLVFLQGAIPGPTGGVITVKDAVKTPDTRR